MSTMAHRCKRDAAVRDMVMRPRMLGAGQRRGPAPPALKKACHSLSRSSAGANEHKLPWRRCRRLGVKICPSGCHANSEAIDLAALRHAHQPPCVSTDVWTVPSTPSAASMTALLPSRHGCLFMKLFWVRKFNIPCAVSSDFGNARAPESRCS